MEKKLDLEDYPSYTDGLTYANFFKIATGFEPKKFQLEIGNSPLKEDISAPTGAGKTAAIIVKFLWELYQNNNPHRRLLFCLPMRSLTTQVSKVAREYVNNTAHLFSEENQVLIYTLMGGDFDNQFVIDSAHPQIVISVADIAIHMLVDIYGSPKIRDIFFGILSHDTWVVLDEVQLVPYAGTTLKHLRVFYKNVSTASGRTNVFTLMSATNQYKFNGETEDLQSNKKKFVYCEDKKIAIQKLINTSGKRIFVVNTVKKSREYAEQLRQNSSSKVLCLNSNFIEMDKERILEDYEKYSDVILVATQVIEAGVDITSNLMITELSTIASFVQRAGRLCRRGELNGECLVIKPDNMLPYKTEEINSCIEFIKTINNTNMTAIELCKMAEQYIPKLPNTNYKRFCKTLCRNMDSYSVNIDFQYDNTPFVRESSDSKITIIWSSKANYPNKKLSLKVKKTANIFKIGNFEVWNGKNWEKGQADDIDESKNYRFPYEHFGYDVFLGFTDDENNYLTVYEPIPSKTEKSKNRKDNAIRYDKILSSDEIIILDRHLQDAFEESKKMTKYWTGKDNIDVVNIAASLHDLGKESCKWQNFIRSRSDNSKLPEKSIKLAKSVGKYEKIDGHEGDSGYSNDAGPRHEYLSTFMLDLDKKHLKDLKPSLHLLCKWLVLCHHGHVKFNDIEPKIVNGDKKILNISVTNSNSCVSEFLESNYEHDILKEINDCYKDDLERLYNQVIYGQIYFIDDMRQYLNFGNRYEKARLLQLLATLRAADWKASSSYVT